MSVRLVAAACAGGGCNEGAGAGGAAAEQTVKSLSVEEADGRVRVWCVPLAGDGWAWAMGVGSGLKLKLESVAEGEGRRTGGGVSTAPPLLTLMT